jgi:hypothetical protein
MLGKMMRRRCREVLSLVELEAWNKLKLSTSVCSTHTKEFCKASEFVEHSDLFALIIFPSPHSGPCLHLPLNPPPNTLPPLLILQQRLPKLLLILLLKHRLKSLMTM